LLIYIQYDFSYSYYVVTYATNEEIRDALNTTNQDFDQPRKMMLDIYTSTKSATGGLRPVFVKFIISLHISIDMLTIILYRFIFMVELGEWVQKICFTHMKNY
jgi:hypothetical protein